MEYRVSQRFLSDLQYAAGRGMRDEILKTVRELTGDPDLPGLRVARTEMGAWYCRITRDWRLLFEWGADRVPVLLRAIPHAVFDRLTRKNLGVPDVAWLSEPAFEGVEPVETFQVPEEWSRPGIASDYPLRGFTTHQLRLLGVPAGLARSLRDAPTINDALSIPNLSPRTQDWLMALHTDPSEPLRDPFSVFKRATLEQLEDLADGKIRDLLLDLADEQRSHVERAQAGATLLKGVAGSGKTTVGIYRAVRLASLGRRVLFITYNPILQHVTRNLIEEVMGPLPANLRVENYQAWVLDALSRGGLKVNLASMSQALEFVRVAVNEVSRGRRSTVLERDEVYFYEEIQRVIKGFGLTEVNDYRTAPRYGRKTALSPLARVVVWEVMQVYNRQLAAAGLQDWGDAVTQVYTLMLERPDLDLVDDVIIDEAQDLTPLELRVLQRVVRGERIEDHPAKTILVLGDAAQSLYSRGFTWKQVGLDVVGRSQVLRTNYRNTKEIVQSASDLASRNQHLKDQGELIEMDYVLRHGPRPLLREFDAEHEAWAFVIEEITRFREENLLRLRDVAVIAATPGAARDYASALNKRGLPADLWDLDALDVDVLRESVKVMTIKAAKGLEFPVVFMVGLTRAALGSPASNTEPEEREITVERDRMQFYVGMTRSAELLYVLATRLDASPFIRELSFIDAAAAR